MKNYAKRFQGWKRPFAALAYALIVISALLLIGCRATKVQSSVSHSRVDSVIIRQTVRDTVVTVKADSSMIRALLECDSLGQVRMRELVEYRAGERTKPPDLSIKENVLTAKADVDSVAIFMQLKDLYEYYFGNTKEVIIETVEVNRLTWWQKLWVKAGQILSGALVALIIFKIIKLKIFK